MRKAEYFGMGRAEAIELLAGAPAVHLASTNERGEPVLRTLHAVVLDGGIYFHAAPVGEKSEAVGKAAVIAAEEVVATLPSYLFDPERACPATTYYRSAQVHGVLEDVADVHVKARVLQALMEKHQPEGGHVTITADDPRYRGAVRGIAVVKMSLERVEGKAKLGQNRRPEELAKVLEFLWKRGGPGDVQAIELVRAANPEIPTPGFLQAPEGARLVCAPGAGDVTRACELLAGEYWNVDVPREVIARAIVGSTAWVAARDEAGALVGMARAVADGAKFAYLFDVIVAPQWRGRGLGKALVRMVLDHPRARDARRVVLATRDAAGLYRRFGFVERGAPKNPEMMLMREMAR